MPPIDPFAGYPDSVISQGRKLKQITPHDVNDLPIIPKALFCTVAGNLAFIPADGYETAAGADAGSLTIAVTVGQEFDTVRVKRVLATGTTATVLAVL